MEAVHLLLQGFAVLLTWKILTMMLIGLVLGIFVGVLPGLGGPNGVAILLPLTFTMDPTTAIVMLSCIYWGALFGGAITSILFKSPGRVEATTFDAIRWRSREKQRGADRGVHIPFIGSLVAVLLITFLRPGSHRRAQVRAARVLRGLPLTFCSFVGFGREGCHKTVIRWCSVFCLRRSAWTPSPASYA
jgi:TctA family transporter